LKRLLVFALIAGACNAAPLASQATSVEMGEFFVSPESSNWSAGSMAVHVANEGEFAHTLVVSNSEGKVVYASPVVEGGESTDLQLDLQPDIYLLTCRIVVQSEGDIYDHFELGMRAEIDVTA
jgi:hypothetical protein